MAAEYPTDVKYTKEHEWARLDGDNVVIGVTFHAQEALGEVVYVELPKVGQHLVAGAPFGVIESTKAVSELFAPLSGTVVKVNDSLQANPQPINTDSYRTGWMVELTPDSLGDYEKLLPQASYLSLLK